MARRKTKKFVIKILCKACRALLYKYKKEGPGALVKCYVSSIMEDHTNGDLKCHKCGQKFATVARYHNRDAHKIKSNKVIVRGHYGK